MSVSSLMQIEETIRRLSLPEQLHLLEWLARSVRQHAQVSESSQVDQLAMMADDPDIQRELRQMAAEFAVTESDGLDKL
ncbi:MAG: hypothetical protein KDE58_10585 [Caldilineaceae bacterium]|nr:hypothetical protein [Caldilineaceae bacterium]